MLFPSGGSPCRTCFISELCVERYPWKPESDRIYLPGHSKAEKAPFATSMPVGLIPGLQACSVRRVTSPDGSMFVKEFCHYLAYASKASAKSDGALSLRIALMQIFFSAQRLLRLPHIMHTFAFNLFFFLIQQLAGTVQ